MSVELTCIVCPRGCHLVVHDDLTVEGADGDYGLYIDTVNGLTADYAVDGAYWSIYVNGEYGNYSADQQPVADGDVYGLVYTVYEE